MGRELTFIKYPGYITFFTYVIHYLMWFLATCLDTSIPVYMWGHWGSEIKGLVQGYIAGKC